MLLIAVSPFRDYALEARSYSLLVGFLAIAAVFWQRIGERRLMALLFAVFLALAVACHHLAVLTIACFGAAELAFTVQSRRIRWTVWIACLFATLPFFVSLPLLLHYKATFGQNFWAEPGWRTAVSTYEDFLGVQFRIFVVVLTLLLGLVLGNALLRTLQRLEKISARVSLILRRSYRSAVFCCTLLSWSYWPRFLVPATSFGMGGRSSSAWHWRRCIWLIRSAVGPFSYLFAALAISFGARDSNEVRKLYIDSFTPPNPGWSRLAKLSREEPEPSGDDEQTYMDATEYAPKDIRDRLVRLVDPYLANYYMGTDTVDKTICCWQGLFR